MKALFYILLIIAGVGLGFAIGYDFFDNLGFVIALLVLFPVIFIFGTIYLGKRRNQKDEIDEEIKKQDRFSKWE